MSGVPEPLPWETSGFWVVLFAIAFFVVLVRMTRGKDDAGRSRAVGRILRWLAVFALVAYAALALNAWFAAAGLPVMGARRNPGELALVYIDALSGAVAVLAALLLAVLVLSGERRPRAPGRRWHVPWEWPVAVGLVVLAALLPVPSRTFNLRDGVRPPPTWTERAPYAGMLLAVVAALVVLQIAVAYAASRGPHRTERREGLRDALALWGFLLLAGAMLFLEGRAADLLNEVRLLGPRSPAWGSLPKVWFDSNRLPLAFAFAGLLATAFGALHLVRRKRIDDAGATALPDNPAP